MLELLSRLAKELPVRTTTPSDGPPRRAGATSEQQRQARAALLGSDASLEAQVRALAGTVQTMAADVSALKSLLLVERYRQAMAQVGRVP